MVVLIANDAPGLCEFGLAAHIRIDVEKDVQLKRRLSTLSGDPCLTADPVLSRIESHEQRP